MAYDTERDSIGLAGAPAPVVLPPGRRGDQFSQMQASDDEIGAAVGQLNAGQPVTALPRQEWSPAQGESFIARLNQFDQQAKAARMAAEQAALDAQMLQQMSRVAKSTKDIEIAKRSIDMMGLQSDIQRGVPIHEAVQRHPMGLGSGFGGALRATAPQAQFSMPTVANPITTPEGKVLGYGAQTGPTTRHIIPETKTGALDASTRKEIDLLSREKTGLDKEMSGVGWEAEEPLPEFKAKHDATRSRRAFVQKRLAELLPGAYETPTKTGTTKKALRNPKTGKWELK